MIGIHGNGHWKHTLDTVAVIGAVVGDPGDVVVDTIVLAVSGEADRKVHDMEVLPMICVHDIEHIDSVCVQSMVRDEDERSSQISVEQNASQSEGHEIC